MVSYWLRVIVVLSVSNEILGLQHSVYFMIKQLLRHSSQVDPSVVLNKRLSVPSHYKQQFRRYSATFPPPKMSSSSSTALDSSISTDIHTTTINKPVKLDLYSWAKSCASSWAKHMTAETRQVNFFVRGSITANSLIVLYESIIWSYSLFLISRYRNFSRDR